MGLKTTNYTIQNCNLTIPNAYAQITHLSVNKDGEAHAIFEVQQTRDDIAINDSLENICLSYAIDKEQPIYKQMYEKAKEELFVGWEDDIVEQQ